VFPQQQRQSMAAESIPGGGVGVAGGEPFIPGQQAADIVSIYRSGMGHLDDNPVFAEHFSELFRLFQQFAVTFAEGIVKLNTNICAGPQNSADFGHHLVPGLKVIAHIGLGIVDK